MDPEELVTVLVEHWGLQPDHLARLDGGMNSRTWAVQAGASQYVAKQVEDADQLAAGCEAAVLLARHGISTGPPIPTRTGELLVLHLSLALLAHVPGEPLTGQTSTEQLAIAEILARVHQAGGPAPNHRSAGFFGWLSPDAPGVTAHPWLPDAIGVVRAGVDALPVTWSLLHTDPAPEAFRRDPSTGDTGLIDWTGAQRGPVMYDAASAVMYLDGAERAQPFWDAYCQNAPVTPAETEHLTDFLRFRWLVQAVYFAGRLAARDLTGITGQHDNQRGFDDARAGLANLGVDTG